MSENFPSDVKLNENPDGTVSFATEVVATIAGLAATEVDGVASMVSPSSGLAEMFSRKSNRNLTKGVRIDLDGSMVTVDITITVEYGSPVPDVARGIQENVKKAIETMSGLDVRSVDVHVTGISFERDQRANAELDEQQRKMLEENEEAAAADKAEEEDQPVEPEDTPEEDSDGDCEEAEDDVDDAEEIEDDPEDDLGDEDDPGEDDLEDDLQDEDDPDEGDTDDEPADEAAPEEAETEEDEPREAE